MPINSQGIPARDHDLLTNVSADDHHAEAHAAAHAQGGADALSGQLPALDGSLLTGIIATGTYTGDGATSQAITGVGFQPRFVLISARFISAGTAVVHFTSDTIVDDNAAGLAVQLGTPSIVTNAIISLDADGFTVDDAGADSHPNQNITPYNWIALR